VRIVSPALLAVAVQGLALVAACGRATEPPRRVALAPAAPRPAAAVDSRVERAKCVPVPGFALVGRWMSAPMESMAGPLVPWLEVTTRGFMGLHVRGGQNRYDASISVDVADDGFLARGQSAPSALRETTGWAALALCLDDDHLLHAWQDVHREAPAQPPVDVTYNDTVFGRL